MGKNRIIVILILFIWFVISFVTNILGPIMPAIIESYHISLTLAAFLPFSFFLAYGIMSIPAGILIEKYGGKTSMILAFSLNFIGVFSFSLFPIYGMAIASLFVVGMGMAMLQVIINPLMRVAGGEENFAFYSIFGQGVFGLASFISPLFYVFLMGQFSEKSSTSNGLLALRKLSPINLPWVSMYWIFSLLFIGVLILIFLLKFPSLELKEEEKSGPLKSYQDLLKDSQVWIYFLGIMAYVGTEQGLADWMSKFLKVYYGFNPENEGAHAISWFWGTMAIGCLLGLALLKLIDAKKALKISCIFAILCLSLALWGSKSISLWAFPLCGFCISLIFSLVFSLALNSVSQYHGSFSGILCSGIFGGALIPFLIGWIGDQGGLKWGLTFLYIPLFFLFWISFWAKPLVDNKIYSWKELFSKSPENKLI